MPDAPADPVGRALDEALAAVMTARLVWKQRAAAEAAGECLHENAATVAAMGGVDRRVCPDCGQVD